ncbi:MAG: MinD/ParA family protein [Clostridiales bacterium]|jgi:flagellar biosynthesis protein FlhG|nr:MinD/ParA family protein [Clostridiales bacterium]
MDQAEKLRRLMEKKDAEKKPFRVITVASGKGGVGKTNFTINLAVSFQKRGLRVAILDADFGMANVDILFGIRAKYSIYDILHNNKSMEEVSAILDNGIKIIPGGSGISDLVDIDIDIEKREKLLSELSKINNIDLLLIDTGAGLSPVVLNFSRVADEVIIVTNSEPTSLTDAYGLIKVLITENINNNIRLVINRVKNVREAQETFNKLSKAIAVFLKTNIKYLGFIIDDEKVGQAVRQQIPFTEIYPKSGASQCISKISSELLGTETKSSSTSIKEYFSKLIKIMGR